MASDAQTLQKWHDYINDYEEKLAADKQHVDAVIANPQSTDAEKKKAIEDYQRNQAFLKELKDKYNEYSEAGVVPDQVTFGGYDISVLVYRTDIPGDTSLHYGTTNNVGGSGDLSTPNSEIGLGTIFQSDLMQVSVKTAETQGYSMSSLTGVTLSTHESPGSGEVWWVLQSNKSLGYNIAQKYTVSGININISNYSWSGSLTCQAWHVREGTIAQCMAASPITTGLTYVFSNLPIYKISEITMPEDTVDGDSPWDYYDNQIKPRVDPDNDLYPEGYNPGKEDDPPEEGKPDRDATDEGEPPEAEEVKYVDSAMTKYYVLTPWQFERLRQALATTVQDTYNNPTDETKFLYRLGKLIKDGSTNRYETSQNNFIGDYLVSCRMYPFDLKESENCFGSNYTNGIPVTAITFGYNGANIDCSDWNEGVYTLYGVIVSCKPLSVTVPCRAGTTNVADVTFLDFEPFTKYSIILPYLGEFEIPARSVLCATLDIHYQIDFSSGTVQAVVYAKGGYNAASTDASDETHPTTILQKAGVIGCSLSVTGNNIVKQGDQMVIAQMGMDKARLHSIVSDVNANLPVAAKTAGGALSTGLEEGPQAGLAQWATSTVSGKVDKIMNIPNRVEEIFGNYTNMCAAGINKSQASRDVPFILSQGTNISPLMNLNQVAVRIQKSIAFYPDGYAHMYGLPKQQNMKIGSLKGFVQTAAFDCSGIGSGTEPVPTEIEQKMIVDALKNGAYQNT